MLIGGTTGNGDGSECNSNFELIINEDGNHEMIINEDSRRNSDSEDEDYRVIINKKQEIVKLPNGVSRAYIDKRDDGELTQIDFPHATYNQYWQVVSLITAHGTVMVHPTLLPIKAELLKGRTSSHGDVPTASYTPVSAPGEVESFGVYESSMIQTHVFVGPFTIEGTREKEITIIYGTPDTTTAKEDSDEEQEDEQIADAPRIKDNCTVLRVHEDEPFPGVGAVQRDVQKVQDTGDDILRHRRHGQHGRRKGRCTDRGTATIWEYIGRRIA